MLPFISWYLLIAVLGWLALPLAWRLFPALADRGYTLARAAGLLVWAYAFWMLATLGLARNDLGGLLLALLVMTGLSAWALSKNRLELFAWLKANARLVLTTEILFLLSFAFLAFVRAANPEILGTEKPMELAFINAILRSPTFPPRDPWLSGYAISYYHFGYVMTAMLARLTSVPGTLAFNLMISLVFGLGAIGAYGLLYNLLAAQALHHPGEGLTARRSLFTPLLAPLFLLLVSNFEVFLELLHRRGLFWAVNSAGLSTSPFWVWLDMKELSQAPAQPLGWLPERHWWWWRASRVVQDYTLTGNHQEVIDEFPFFSFLLGDLHPHVLAIPFGLLMISVALNLFLGGWPGEIKLFGARLHVSLAGFGVAAFVVGAMAYLNIWDILLAAALMVGAYVLLRVRTRGWGWARLEEAVLFAIPLVFTAIMLFLPFFLGFSSQAGGLLPNLVNPTRGAHLWVMFGPLFIPLCAYLLHLTGSPSQTGRWRLALSLTLGLLLLLWGGSWLLAVVILVARPYLGQQFLADQGVTNTPALFIASLQPRLAYLGGLLTLLALIFPALALLTGASPEAPRDEHDPETIPPSPQPFVLTLIILGALLVLGPDFLYLSDQFGWRINTIFKFYYEAWMLWSLAAAFGTALLLHSLRGVADWTFRVLLLFLLLISLTYPALSLPTRTHNFQPAEGLTLDDFDRVRRENPDEAAAIEFLNGASDGVLAEAVGGSYSAFARISTYTGLPTVLGWPGHESQWRGGALEQGSRQLDIQTLYADPDWQATLAILERYNIRYVVIGNLERATYIVQDEKFFAHLPMVFQQGSVTIYEVPVTP